MTWWSTELEAPHLLVIASHRHAEEREINKVIRRSIAQSNKEPASPDAAAVLDALQQQEAPQPGFFLYVELRSACCRLQE